jgi:hypothetical protein
MRFAPFALLLAQHNFPQVLFANLRNVDIKALGGLQNIAAQAQIDCPFSGPTGSYMLGGWCGWHKGIHTHNIVRIF